MATETSKEKRYEDLVNAVAGGELKMVKFLWNLVSEIDALVQQTPQSQIEKRAKEVDALLKKLKDNPPKNGETPTTSQLLALITPLIPKPIKGEPGKTPTKKELKALIESLIPEPIPGAPGKPGQSVQGKPGRMPKHEWSGTRVRFETAPGEWGEFVNLQGTPAEAIEYGGHGGPGVMPNIIVRTVSGQRFQGVTEIVFADNLTVTKTNNGVSVSGEAGGGGGGTGLDFETPSGTIDDSNVTFDVLNTPLYLVVNGAQYFEGVHYTLVGLTITLNDPIGTGGFIRSAFGTGISIETPTGTVDDSNVDFIVTNEPKYIVVNGAQYFSGAGYTYLAGTITLDNPVGTGGFIRSVY